MMRQTLMLSAVMTALVAGARADALFVPSDGSIKMTESLVFGQWYVIESRGYYDYRDTVPEKIADAEWARTSVDDEWVWVETPAAGDLDLYVDGADVLMMGSEDGVTFGPHVFSPQHIYRARILGQGRPAELSIYDTRYDDNIGGLDVTLWPALAGDANADNVVDESDFQQLIKQFGGTPGEQNADFNGDGTVNLADFVLQRNNFGVVLDSGPAGQLSLLIPEPTTFAAILAGLGFLVRRRSGRR